MEHLLKYVLILFLGLTLLNGCENDNSLVDPDDPNTNPKDIVVIPNDFLSENKYDQLIVEIVYVDGYKPQSTSVNHLKSFLNDRLHKSKGITVSYSSIPSPGKSVYSLTDLRTIEETHRTKYPDGKTLGAWFFFADADYADNKENSKTLGVAYGPSSMTLFEKTIKDFTGGLGQPPLNILEASVMEHEFGHILGLVNTGTSMVENHQDTEHGHHCNDDNCLMFYAAETSNFISSFIGGSVPELNQQCINDLRNNGGK